MSRIIMTNKKITIYDEINNLFSLVCKENINPLDIKAFNEYCWGLINRINLEPIKDEFIIRYQGVLLELNRKLYSDNHIDNAGIIARNKQKEKIMTSRKKTTI